MEERQGKNGSYEDWGAVMQMLLHGDPEHKQIAFLKLNRLISSFLVSQAWDYHDHWEDLQQTVLMKLVKSFCQGQLREAQAFAVHLNITTDQTRILVTAVREGEHISLTLTFRDTGQTAIVFGTHFDKHRLPCAPSLCLSPTEGREDPQSKFSAKQ